MTQEQGQARTWNGGCQCGNVRFKVEGPLGEASVCYCRMCQKATGGAFGLFVRIDTARLVWTRGAPKHFVSSNIAKRGFCADCGTPLTWEYEGWLDLAIATFDEAAKIEPSVQLAMDTQFPWVWRLDGLPVRGPESDAEYAEYLASVRSFQHPDHDTQVWPPAGGVR